MRLRISPTETAFGVGVVALALGLVACGQDTPTGPTRNVPVVARPITDATPLTNNVSTVTREGETLRVSWDCFTGEEGGGCPAPRLGASGFGASDVTTPPSNLVQLVQGTTVSLSWGLPPGSQPTGYVIEAGSSSGASNIARFEMGPLTGLSVSNVPAGTYFVRVRGKDLAGTGPASNEVTVVVTGPAPPPGPCQPRNLSAVAIGSAVALGWVEPPGAGSQCGSNRYLIQIGSTPGASNVAQVSTIGLIPSYGATGLAPGTYYIRVRSQGTTLSAASNEVVVTVTGSAPPGTTRWVGLVANGDGATADDDDCGLLRLDLEGTFVQSGASVSGFVTSTVRVAPNCPSWIGVFSITESLSGTATGSLADGSGNFTIRTPTASVTGSFANGRMTGTVTPLDEPGIGTMAMNRQ